MAMQAQVMDFVLVNPGNRKAVYQDPKYLDFVGNKFGSHVVDHLNDMTKIKLKRKILGD